MLPYQSAETHVDSFPRLGDVELLHVLDALGIEGVSLSFQAASPSGLVAARRRSPAAAARARSRPAGRPAPISWKIVIGAALMVTAFSPARAAAVMSIRPNALSSHQASLPAATGLPLQVTGTGRAAR